jgi:tRNA A-37 threonylcarbamoyl transferase component Bud32
MDNMAGKDLGRYHVIEPLGKGGMASVYKAFDSTLERNVAIKIIRSDAIVGDEQAQFLVRFQREARALAQLDHPYILKVLDYGEQAGIPYLVMPFVEGGTLKEKMGRPMPYREAAALLAPIARALEYAHQLKIIHRDVKPANILISRSGAPILSDFGIAKMLGSDGATQLTATGIGIGTPDYMAPEQWMGKADQFTDMYSLGIVFFQMVTGHLPFSAETPAAVLIKHMQDPLPRPSLFVPGMPEPVEQILFKALAKNPENRFPNMGAFAEVLEQLALSDKTTLPHMSLPVDASQATVVHMQAVHPPAAVTAPVAVPPVRKKMAGWLVGLIILGGMIVVGALVTVIAGAYFATRYFSGTKPSSVIPPAAVVTQGNPLSATTPVVAASNVTPFLTIQGFPDDVPMLADNQGDLTVTNVNATSADSPTVTDYSFSTKMTFQQVSDFYKAGMDKNGWTLRGTTTGNNMVGLIFIKGDNRLVEVAITTVPDKQVQKVQISIQPGTQPTTPTPMESAANVTPFLTIQGFPDDIPILTDNEGDLESDSSAAQAGAPATAIYEFDTKMPIQQAADFYMNGMTTSGWKITDQDTVNNVFSGTLTKGNRTVYLNIFNGQNQPVQHVKIMIIWN